MVDFKIKASLWALVFCITPKRSHFFYFEGVSRMSRGLYGLA